MSPLKAKVSYQQKALDVRNKSNIGIELKILGSKVIMDSYDSCCCLQEQSTNTCILVTQDGTEVIGSIWIYGAKLQYRSTTTVWYMSVRDWEVTEGGRGGGGGGGEGCRSCSTKPTTLTREFFVEIHNEWF